MSSLSFGAILLVVGAVGTVEERSFDSTNLEQVVIKNERGNVKIVGGDVDKASIVATKRSFDDGCRLVMERTGNELVAENRRDDRPDRLRCEVDFEIVVPRNIGIRVAAGIGNVSSSGTQGQVDAKVGKGDVEIEGNVAALNVAVGKGDITVRGLTASADLKAGKGDVGLTYDRMPETGDLTIRVGRGDAKVHLPPSARVSARLVAGSGRMTNAFANDPEARFKISMKAGRGDLRILKR